MPFRMSKENLWQVTYYSYLLATPLNPILDKYNAKIAKLIVCTKPHSSLWATLLDSSDLWMACG